MLMKLTVITFQEICKSNHYAVHLKLQCCMSTYISIKLEEKNKVLVRIWRKGNTGALLVGMYIGAAIMENSMEVPQNTKNRITI